jgi:hypothetical protein
LNPIFDILNLEISCPYSKAAFLAKIDNLVPGFLARKKIVGFGMSDQRAASCHLIYIHILPTRFIAVPPTSR